jgi:hypothetical protein
LNDRALNAGSAIPFSKSILALLVLTIKPPKEGIITHSWCCNKLKTNCSMFFIIQKYKLVTFFKNIKNE